MHLIIAFELRVSYYLFELNTESY